MTLTKEDCEERGWFCRTDLKRCFRLKPTDDQEPAARYWQGFCWVYVYDKEECEPMRPYREPTEAQLEALAQGRELVGTKACPECGDRFESPDKEPSMWCGGTCFECTTRARLQRVVETARGWLEAKPVILDTETTGVGEDAEVIEIAMLEHTGEVLLEERVKPKGKVPAEASAIHGIGQEELVDAPSWSEVAPRVQEAIAGRPVVGYNIDFDVRLVKQTALKCGAKPPNIERTHCVMKLYARWLSAKYPQYCDGSWVALREAVQGWASDELLEEVHQAKGDCRLALCVLKGIARESDGGP